MAYIWILRYTEKNEHFKLKSVKLKLNFAQPCLHNRSLPKTFLLSHWLRVFETQNALPVKELK